MGWSLSWIAVSAPAQAVQDALALRGTGVREEILESAEYWGAELPNGKYLIVSRRDYLNFQKDAVLAPISRIGEVVMCFIEEHVMYSTAAYWRDGQCVWLVWHDSDKSIYHLEVKGSPPPQIVAIRERRQLEQSAENPSDPMRVDYIIDIPLDLAQELAGYRHDEDIAGLSGDVFEILESTAPPKPKSWIERLLG